MLLVGEDKVVKDVLADNYRSPSPPPAPSVRSIDTSVLPLQLTSFPLAGTGSFAANDELIRGALAKVESSLLLMDKLGNIFEFKDNSLRKMDYGDFPNGIRQAIVNPSKTSRRPLPLTAVRALYIAYHSGTSTLFVSQQKYNPTSKHVRFTISSITIDKATLSRTSDWKTVFETEDISDESSFRGATGGRLLIDGSLLYFSVGDYNFGQVPVRQHELVAQDKASSFGKVYEHDITIGSTRVKSVGHRNPQGLAIDNAGRLVNTEHGPEGGDELNVIVDGNNYGWPYKTYGTDYGTFGWPIAFKPLPDIKFAEPLFTWVPSIAVSPVIRIGAFNQRWEDDLLVGSLKAQSLFRLRLREGRVLFSEPIWIGHRIRDIVEMPGGLALMTDDPALIFLRVDDARLMANSKMQKSVELTPALAKCLNCHHFGDTNSTHLAPTLASIVGKRIASDTFQRYSDALKNKGGVWTVQALESFVGNPGKFAAGTSMPNLSLSESQVKEAVAALGTIKQK